MKKVLIISALAFGLLVVAGSAYAVTTISTNISTGGTLTVTGAASLNAAATVGTDLTVTSGARIGTGSTPDAFTALADDSFFVEGLLEVDGNARFDGTLNIAGNLYSPFTASVNLGLGTTTPLARISVAGTSGAHPMILVDARTGFANSLIDLKIASSSKFLINSSGYVGVGTTTPSAQLAVTASSIIGAVINQSGTGDIFRLNDDGVTVFKVADGGNVGVGTTTPLARISVAGTSGAHPMILVDARTGFANSLIDLKIASSSKFLINSSGQLGIASSTPTADISINSGIATTTIKASRLCFESSRNTGPLVHYWIRNDGSWASTTGACE